MTATLDAMAGRRTLSAAEVAILIGGVDGSGRPRVSARAIWRLAARGELVGRKVGRAWVFDPPAVAAFLERGR